MRVPVIDFHTHVFPQYADLAVQVMDLTGIATAVVLAWHDGFGEGLDRHFAAFDRHPGRFIVFGNVDLRRVNEAGFGRTAARQLELGAARGMRGLKVYKNLGLELRKPDGTFWRPNDPELDPLWARAGELQLPVLIHSADPPAFWEPVNEANFWNGVLHGEYAWWSYHGKETPTPRELLADRLEVAARHPKTTFIFPHVGDKTEALESAAEDLERFPNIMYDLSARLPDLARTARRAALAREFVQTYADRILFGTDMIFDETNVPTGQQAQILYQPGEIPLNGADPEKRYVQTSVDFMRSNLEFLTSDAIQHSPPFRRSRTPWAMHGLGLSREAVEKIVFHNARKLLETHDRCGPPKR